MKSKTMLLGLLLTLVAASALPAWAQDDEDVRGAFMTTRPKANEKASKPATKPSHRRPKPAPGLTPEPVISGDTTKPKKALPRMGLGLTLFIRDSTGLAVRTDPTREFHKGDHVRVLLETNADGYLYVFNTTNNGQPVMIYPDPTLDEAGNYVQAHVPFEIPSSTAAEERLRWFTFDQNAGAEKLYFVFSREPLSGVPIEDDLISFCRENGSKCPWHPAVETWAALGKELSEPVKVKQGRMEGAQTPAEHRGIGLNSDDPEPSLIMLSVSTNRNILIATLELVHKV
jgi:hypothetical protein